MERKLRDALPGSDGALCAAVWEFMRPMLSPALLALNRDFIIMLDLLCAVEHRAVVDPHGVRVLVLDDGAVHERAEVLQRLVVQVGAGDSLYDGLGELRGDIVHVGEPVAIVTDSAWPSARRRGWDYCPSGIAPATEVPLGLGEHPV